MSESLEKRAAAHNRIQIQDALLQIDGFGNGELATVSVAATQNWVEYGMVENTIAIFDQTLPFMDGKINVFASEEYVGGYPRLRFSKTTLENLPCIGRLVASVNFYDRDEFLKIPTGRRKVYVAVKLDVDVEGNAWPRAIVWENGRSYAIDKVVDRRRAPSTKVGGCGMRYTVRIEGKERYLFNEDARWFMEAIDCTRETVMKNA